MRPSSDRYAKGCPRKNRIAKAIDDHLKRWSAFTAFLDDGRICLSNNADMRAIRGIAVGRKNWIFAGSDSGGGRAAAIYTPISCKLNDVDARAWLADVLARINDHPMHQLDKLLPWNWQTQLPEVLAGWLLGISGTTIRNDRIRGAT